MVLIGAIRNLWLMVLAEPFLEHICRHGLSFMGAVPCGATWEEQHGFICLVMTNTSPEENSREVANGTIKLVTQAKIILDISVKLHAFTAKISSTTTQERDSCLFGTRSDNSNLLWFLRSLLLFSTTGSF